MTASRPTTPPSENRRGLRLGCAVAAGILLLGILFVGWRLIATAVAGRAALNELRALQSLDISTLADFEGDGLVEVRNHFAALETNLDTIQRQFGPFLPAARAFGWLPRLGEEAAAAPDLLTMASSAATAGRAAMDGALLVLEAYQQPAAESALQRIVPAIETAEPYWQEADDALRNLSEARARLNVDTLDPRLSSQIERLDRYLPLLRGGVALAKSAPALLGIDEARTYLLLAQNSDELRPTGGFISGVGLLRIDRGDFTQLDFGDSYAVYNPAVDHPLAPADLERTMGAQMLLLRDANWSPDFPTVAGVASSLYQLDTGTPVDGVVAFDVEAVRRLIAALGPLQLPGYQEVITADNLTEAIRTVWEAPVNAEAALSDKDPSKSDWWLHRKDFMGDLAAAGQVKIEAGGADLVKLAQAIYSALQEKHILLSLDDTAAMAFLTELGWSGAVQPGPGDTLMVVDTNVGWNKVNALVDRSTVYRIMPRSDGSAEAVLELSYRHRGNPTDQPCVHESRYGDTYADMAQRCYFDYVRVVVPEDVRLVAVDGVDPASVGTLRGENGTSILAGDLTLPPGHTAQVRFHYELPPGTVGDDRYELRLLKQPGTPGWPVSIIIQDSAGRWAPGHSGGERMAEGAKLDLHQYVDVDLEFVRAE